MAYFGAAKIFVSVGLALFCGLLSPASANAAIFTVNSFDNGSYAFNGLHSPSNTNIFVGNAGNNWLAFNVSPAAGATITGATLRFFGGNGNYVSPDVSETYGLFDYLGNINSLLNGTGGVSTFNDLGSGTSYGQATVNGPSGISMPDFSVSLSLAAVAAISAAANSADSRFVIGGTILTLANLGNVTEALFVTSSALPAAALTIETSPSAVPLPAALPLFATGLAGLGLLGWRRKRRAAAASARA